MPSRVAVRSGLATAVFGLAVMAMTPAHAGVEVGMLSCHSPARASYAIVSTRNFDCTFRPSAGGPVERYKATLHRVGAQLGISSNVALGWAVFAATRHMGPGALAGGYGGVSAGAAVGVGADANGLVGGTDNAFSLQPVSLQSEMGLNVVATVTGLDLRSVPARVRHYRRHRRYRR